ncbi:MAG TPA: Npt1/Npt2 family nucleotide transporter [Longimicrobiales bacterium]|nr:Npt1/Npt2 family nucleotide transporter [Longimicrobiales bacterium]
MALKVRRGGTFADARMVSMMALFFLVVCAVGILRPIKNSLALDGLGATDFYKVYLTSAVVVLFVPLFTRAADRLPWRWLIPGLALFFASHLVLFRVLYVEGSAALGLIFYGWYDLFAAALVTQFFMTAQVFFDARTAKQAYPVVIAGGSIGATLGGAITGFFAESVGTPNLLLVAAFMIVLFSMAMPFVWREAVVPPRERPATSLALGGEIRAVFADPHVRLIAGMVLLTILVKQLVDFQFNAITKDVFETRDAVSAFQGKFNAATQWLPLVVLAALRPALRRWGVGVAVLLLPLSMMASAAALAVAFGLYAAVAAKGAETALRYSAERAGREILYVPVADEIKLKAKAYIDVGLEKGVGKVSSALLLAVLMTVITYRQVAYVTLVLAGLWVVLALAVHREYLSTLARSIEGRFASLKGVALALSDASSQPALRRALRSESAVQSAFGLELLDGAPAADLRPFAPELNGLVQHEDGAIRAAALALLARVPEQADETAVRARLRDEEPAVTDAALRVLIARAEDGGDALLREVLASDQPALRLAALRRLVEDGRLATTRVVGREYIERRWPAASAGDAAARAELALAAGGLQDDPEADRYLDPFLDDADPRVRGTALRSAALLGRIDAVDRMIAALGDHATRADARAALVQLGAVAIAPLARALLDVCTPGCVRRAIPSVLAQIPEPQAVAALLELVLAPETDQLLDYRSIKALSKLRARHPSLPFDARMTRTLAEREAHAALTYATALQSLGGRAPDSPLDRMLHDALRDGWHERRESVFRCIGLLHPPDEVYRAYVGTSATVRHQRANALEWLEQTLGRVRFTALEPVLDPVNPEDAAVAEGAVDLSADGDAWIARLWQARAGGESTPMKDVMELIEKVLLLQRVDLLRGARGAQLALLASIAEEVSVADGATIMAAGEPTTAMYIVTRGRVALHGVGERLELATDDAFGTWALIDDSPSPLEVQALEPTRLLRISRADFHDLLTDEPELSLALLQGLARRMRSLVT